MQRILKRIIMRTKICIILTVLFWTASSFAQTMSQKLNITIGGVTQTATLADNTATQELVNRLQNAPVTVTLNSSGGFEIWGALGFSLPTSNQQINAQPGDIVLYNGSNICMFYGSNSWSYTRLGHIDGLSQSELQTFLQAGESNISVTLSLQNSPTGTDEVTEWTQAVKVVRDGKIHIERNGYTYNIDGKRL